MQQQQQGSFTNRTGLQIHQQSWAPEGDIVAIVLVVHGLAEHSSRCQAIAEFLTESGYALCTSTYRVMASLRETPAILIPLRTISIPWTNTLAR